MRAGWARLGFTDVDCCDCMKVLKGELQKEFNRNPKQELKRELKGDLREINLNSVNVESAKRA